MAADEPEPSLDWQGAVLLLVGAALGALLAAVVAPRWVPGLAESFLGQSPKAYWYLSRASGLVAYLLLWLSVVLGLAVTNRLARLWSDGPTVVDLHQFASLLSLAFSVFHALILLGDRYVGYTLAQLAVPFTSLEYRPVWVGLGQLAFYLALPVAFSFYVRRAIGVRAWRLVHYASFAVFVASAAHGLAAGTDTTALPVAAFYGVTAASVFLLTVARVLVALPIRPARPAPPLARPSHPRADSAPPW